MYTKREMPFPSPVTFVHTKVAPPLSPILISILSVSFLHTKAMTYCLSKLGCRNQKMQTHITSTFYKTGLLPKPRWSNLWKPSSRALDLVRKRTLTTQEVQPNWVKKITNIKSVESSCFFFFECFFFFGRFVNIASSPFAESDDLKIKKNLVTGYS